LLYHYNIFVHLVLLRSLSIADPNGPIRIDENNRISPPRVSRSNVYVTWIEEPSITRESDVFIAVYNNTGQTFNTTRLSKLDPETRANNIINNPVVSGDNIYVTWREDKYNHPPFLQNAFIAVSNDNGASFKTEGLSIFGQVLVTYVLLEILWCHKIIT